MRSKILQQIISETPQEVNEQVDRIAEGMVKGKKSRLSSFLYNIQDKRQEKR